MIKRFYEDDSGAMTMEAAIITATLVALAIIFRKQLSSLWNSAADAMTKQKDDMGAENAFEVKQ